MNQHLNTIILVGRPNVGKSTLFNRLFGRRQAIEDGVAGTTRDPLGAAVELANGKAIWLVDTAGDEAKPLDLLLRKAGEKRQRWLEEAVHVLAVFDARVGVTAEDERVIRAVRRTGKPFTVVAACADNGQLADAALAESDRLGVSVIPVSALHKRGINELRHLLLDYAKPYEYTRPFGVALLGRPNAGKSTLFNTLIQDELSIVSDIPGTTRDVLSYEITTHGQTISLFDTAGMTKRSRMMQGLWRFATLRLEDTLNVAQCVLLCVDATTSGFHHETRLAQKALEAGCSLILVVTKWDTVEETPANRELWMKKLQKAFHFVSWAPVIFISAHENTHVDDLWAVVAEARAARDVRIDDDTLKEFVKTITQEDRRLRILQKIEQLDTNPPRFIGVLAMRMELTLKRQIQNRVRDTFKVGPTPVIWRWRQGQAPLPRRERR